VSDLNLQIVREYFELNHFLVRTHWQHEESARYPELGSMLFVEHISPEPGAAGFLPLPEEVSRIARAVVEVRAWHGDRFYPSVIESSPVLGHVAEAETLALAESVFDSSDFTTILVISELPASNEPRERAIALLRDFGIGHVLEFSTILRETLARISAHGNYAPSQTLQTMRLLKRYGLIRRQQLEFAFPVDPPPPVAPSVVHAEVPPDPEEE
jgi:hypothetical protein